MTHATCGVISPNGAYGCTLLIGHHLSGNPTCKNTSSGVSWCGYCGEFTCDIHNVRGNSHRTLSAYELERLFREAEAQ